MKRVVMIGTRFDTMGGISSVVNVYREGGMFDRYPIEYLPTHRDGGAGAKLRVAAQALRRYVFLLVTGRIGLVHVHLSSRASFWRKSLFVLLAFVFHVRTLLHLHGGQFPVFYDQECGAFRKRLVRYIFDHASHVVVLSGMWEQWVASISRNQNIEIIHNPVLLPATQPFNARKPASVLCLGRLGTNKGSYDLLRAVAKVASKYPMRVFLGGDGEVEQVRRYAAELGISDRVELLGWVSGEAKARYLSSAMIYALPSYQEALPMSVLEAMAAGLPVVSTRVGGIPEAVSDGIEGFLISAGDVDALADRLEQLLTQPGLAQRMGEAARRKVETNFSVEAVLPRIERLYKELGYV